MTDKEFDKLLKGKLEDYRPDYDENSWEGLENRIENELGPPANDPFDDAVRAALGQFAVPVSDGNWEEMERRIIEDENKSFDSEVRENVTNYEVPYDASSWPVLDEKIASEERFRRKLMGAKILEVAAILIALVTFYNFFPDIKNSLFDEELIVATEENVSSEKLVDSDGPVTANTIQVEENQNDVAAVSQITNSNSSVSNTSDQLGTATNNIDGTSVQQDVMSGEFAGASDQSALIVDQQVSVSNRTDETSDLNSEITSSSDVPDVVKVTSLGSLESINPSDHQLEVVYPVDGPVSTISDSDVRTLSVSENVMPVEVLGITDQLDPDIDMAMPGTVLSRKRKSLRFSFGASMDLNALYMPTDQFYFNGNNIRFNEKHLLATGYSAGVGLLFGDGAWNFETGLYYSSKSYEPNRILKVGKTFDVRTVDFNEISLHIVSVPMYAHWNFDRKGQTRFYAVMGVGVNIIATANYDLITKANFRSGPSGGVPDKKTDSDVARIREHILDGAEFSSKSYITTVAGFGVEHFISEKFSVYAQPTYNYQVPFFQFSDQNGKQFQYISMQLGTRVRLR